ncbi:glycosyltransferase [Virgibacillus sp. W0181]|uniref:glycosyltransferase n=1 Tax=Virgibacillus sp. W0181 TaxID=3391581 RepID=UPI003F447F12
MKKKILFMLISMNVGGTERAFLNMLHELPKEEYDITVLLLQKKGGFYQDIPKHVTIKEMKDFPQVGRHLRHLSYNPKQKIKEHLYKRRYKEALFLFALQSYIRVTKDRRMLFKIIFKKVPMMKDEYDIAVAYAGPMDIITYYIATRVKAAEKHQWIHFDVNQIGFDLWFAKKMYKSFNRIFVVSKTAATNLKEKIPTLSNKIETQVSSLPVSTITQFAEKEDVFNTSSTLKIVTVARVMKEKGPDIAVKVLYELKKLGYNIQWHWIGEGEWMVHIKNLIKELDVEDSFILEGLKSNPYPYIRQSDIYVQPSRHEGYCLTIAEARALKKPIVATDTAGAAEQIKNGETGLISGVDVQELLQSIVKLIENPKLRIKFGEALKRENVGQLTPVNFKERNTYFERNTSRKQSTV